MWLSTASFPFPLGVHPPVTFVTHFAQRHYLHEHQHFSLIFKSHIGEHLEDILQLTLLRTVILSHSMQVWLREYLTLGDFFCLRILQAGEWSMCVCGGEGHTLFVWRPYNLKLCFYCNDQKRKETETTALSTIAVATTKAKEQETVLRSREAMTTRQEHIQVTHGKVTVLFQCGIHDNLLIPDLIWKPPS